MSRASPQYRAQSSNSRRSTQPSRSSGTGSCSPRPVPLASRRPPLERILDHRLQSVSTFVSSTSTLGASFGEQRSGQLASQWSEDMPQAILFPANKPSSRADAAILDRWITGALAAYAQRPPGSREGEELSRAVEELVPILSIGLHEVVRQMTQHCYERGLVLEKIWRTYVELFETALGATRAALRRHKEKTSRVEADLSRARGELSDLKTKHPEQIMKLSATLAGKFSQRQDELEEQLRVVRNENVQLQEHLKEQRGSLQSWFPLFPKYKDSYYKTPLASTSPVLPTTTTPEARIAADYRRIIAAMPPEGRRRVGFFVSSLLGLRGFTQSTADTAETLTDRKEHNAWKIEQLEARLKELQDARARAPRMASKNSSALPAGAGAATGAVAVGSERKEKKEELDRPDSAEDGGKSLRAVSSKSPDEAVHPTTHRENPSGGDGEDD